MREVTLSLEEIAIATDTANSRQSEALRKGLKDKHGFSGDGSKGLGIHVLGSIGEFAASKAMGVPWKSTVNTFSAPDLGTKIQVRTRSKHWHDLIVRGNDSNDHVFVLVTGSAPNFKVWGFIKGADAKQQKWLRTHGAREQAYFVPKEDLSPIETWSGETDIVSTRCNGRFGEGCDWDPRNGGAPWNNCTECGNTGQAS